MLGKLQTFRASGLKCTQVPNSPSNGICPAVMQQNGYYSWCLQAWPQAAAHLKGFKRKSTYNCHKQLPNTIFALTCLSTFQPPSAQVCPDIHPSLPLWEFMNPPSLHPLLSLPQPRVPSDLYDIFAPHSLLCLSVSLLHETKEVTLCCWYQTVMKNLQGRKSLSKPFPRRYV